MFQIKISGIKIKEMGKIGDALLLQRKKKDAYFSVNLYNRRLLIFGVTINSLWN
jgi:hypothetical protein